MQTRSIMTIEPSVEFDQDIFLDALADIENSKDEAELRVVFTAAYKNPKIVCNIQAKNKLVDMKNTKKANLENQQFLEELGPDDCHGESLAEETAQ